MEVSTPFRQNLRRRSLLNVSAVSSPLRKSTVGGADVSLLVVNQLSQYKVLLSLYLKEPADDEKERTNRRSMVAMQRRLTNITSSSMSPLVDSNPIIDESQIKDHLRICTKLYTENVSLNICFVGFKLIIFLIQENISKKCLAVARY
jgi:hypothetical protein